MALMNPGGVRADLTYAQISGGEQPGQVTYGEAFIVQPFGNLLVTMDMTGAQLERPARAAGRLGPTRWPGPVHLRRLEGLAFTYNPAGAFGAGSSGQHQLNGAVIEPAATYRMVTNSFLADGGDAFTVFREGTNRVGGGDDLEALIAYLGANSPVAPPADRIAGI